MRTTSKRILSRACFPFLSTRLPFEQPIVVVRTLRPGPSPRSPPRALGPRLSVLPRHRRGRRRAEHLVRERIDSVAVAPSALVHVQRRARRLTRAAVSDFPARPTGVVFEFGVGRVPRECQANGRGRASSLFERPPGMSRFARGCFCRYFFGARLARGFHRARRRRGASSLETRVSAPSSARSLVARNASVGEVRAVFSARLRRASSSFASAEEIRIDARARPETSR